MYNRIKAHTGIALFTFIAVVWLVPFLSSCGKSSTVAPSVLNVQYQIINLSPDLFPVDLYIKFKKVNQVSFSYPVSSGYFYLTAIDTPFQIRPTQNTTVDTVISTATLFNLDDILKPGFKYTLFITGLTSDKSITKIFTADTGSLPKTGRGKIRFINASPRSVGLDVIANGTPAFTNAKYLSVSGFLELPAGNYDFKIYATGAPGTELHEIPNFTVQDGKLYNMYSYGLVGHTDSLAFGANLLQFPIK